MAGIAICTHTELLLPVMAGLFVVITASVIIQVASFKATGKRVFLMSPLQHHFELTGWPEVLIVTRFWIVSGLFTGVGFVLFYTEWLGGGGVGVDDRPREHVAADHVVVDHDDSRAIFDLGARGGSGHGQGGGEQQRRHAITPFTFRAGVARGGTGTPEERFPKCRDVNRVTSRRDVIGKPSRRLPVTRAVTVRP